MFMKNRNFLLSFILSISVFLTSNQVYSQASYDTAATYIGNIGLQITNVGTTGRPNVRTNPTGVPSMRYPINSGIEHLFEAGLWIGALVNGQTLVSTAALDAASGYSTGAAGFEFTGITEISQKSSLPNSPLFSGNAVSHQDYNVRFTDSNIVIPGTSIIIGDHTQPLGAVVNLETYAWNFNFADFFVILNHKITNNSNTRWDSVYIGYWSDLVVRNVNITQDAGTNFFNKGGGGYLDTFNAVYAYQVNGDDADFTRSYGASQIHGVLYKGEYFSPKNANYLNTKGYTPPTVEANFWNFRSFDGSDFGTPSNDLERYAKMKKGLTFDIPQGPNGILAQAGNKIQLISIGPIPSVEPGETVDFVLALVCAKQIPDGASTREDTELARTQLLENLNWSRRTFLGEDFNGNGVLDEGEDLNGNGVLNRYILPEPPATPKMKIIPDNKKVTVYWDGNALESTDPISRVKDFEGFNIYITNPGNDLDQNLSEDLKLVATFDSSNNETGVNNGFKAIELPEPIFFEGDTTPYRFKYEFQNLLNGWQYLVVVTSFDKGDTTFNLTSLESTKTAAVSCFPGTTTSSDFETNPIGVYPNPYRTSAAWDGATSRTKKIYFTNLPPRAEITIYTQAGELVATLQHNSSDYVGQNADWFSRYSSRNVEMSGGEHAWDILSSNKQAVSQGLYLFSVRNLDNNEVFQGTFTILK
jgi:hypothetical protein